MGSSSVREGLSSHLRERERGREREGEEREEERGEGRESPVFRTIMSQFRATLSSSKLNDRHKPSVNLESSTIGQVVLGQSSSQVKSCVPAQLSLLPSTYSTEISFRSRENKNSN